MIKRFILAVAMMAATHTHADCPQLYPNSTPIKINGAVELCNTHYVSLYDPFNMAVLLTSELVQPTAHDIPRKDAFKRDKRTRNLPPSVYKHTDFDKGHMAPADDASTPQEMNETFLMTNMTPQDPTLNRVRWRVLEGHVRTAIESSGKATHVVTVAIYPKVPNLMNGQIPIPFSYGKVAYMSTGTNAWFTTNTASDVNHLVDVDWLNTQIPFAKLPK